MGVTCIIMNKWICILVTSQFGYNRLVRLEACYFDVASVAEAEASDCEVVKWAGNCMEKEMGEID